MRKASLLVALFCFSVAVYGQQDPQFSQFMNNRLFANPGVAGSNGGICATLLGRQQWVGFDGKPESVLFSAHGAIKQIYGGVGLVVVGDRLGQESTVNAKLSYAFRTSKLGPGDLGVGIGFGIINKSLQNDWQSTDAFTQDAAIPDNGAGDFGFDLDFGLYYEIKDQLYFGLSATHLTASQLTEFTDNPSGTDIDFNYGVARHFYVMAGYYHDLNAEWQLNPNLLVKSDAISTQIDVNVTAMYNKMVWGGVSYRLQDAIVPMVGVQYQAPGQGVSGGIARIGYSYDVTTSLLRQHSSGSHEIMLNYCFNIEIPPKLTKHKTVRFL